VGSKKHHGSCRDHPAEPMVSLARPDSRRRWWCRPRPIRAGRCAPTASTAELHRPEDRLCHDADHNTDVIAVSRPQGPPRRGRGRRDRTRLGGECTLKAAGDAIAWRIQRTRAVSGWSRKGRRRDRVVGRHRPWRCDQRRHDGFRRGDGAVRRGARSRKGALRRSLDALPHPSPPCAI
jgi:hypothetical protein